jgi:hypothetical protein
LSIVPTTHIKNVVTMVVNAKHVKPHVKLVHQPLNVTHVRSITETSMIVVVSIHAPLDIGQIVKEFANFVMLLVKLVLDSMKMNVPLVPLEKDISQVPIVSPNVPMEPGQTPKPLDVRNVTKLVKLVTLPPIQDVTHVKQDISLNQKTINNV